MKKLLKKLRLYLKRKSLEDLQKELVEYEEIYRRIYKSSETTADEIKAIFTLINNAKTKIAKNLWEISTLKEAESDEKAGK